MAQGKLQLLKLFITIEIVLKMIVLHEAPSLLWAGT